MIKLQTKSTNFTFNFTFFAVIAIFILLHDSEIALLGLLACILHELGHFISCKICKVRVEEISFSCTGLCIKKLSAKNLTYKKELCILSSGITANFLIFVILLFSPSDFFGLFGMINLAVAVFNLLPLSSFDGFQIRELIISRNAALENIESYNKLFNFIDIILIVLMLYAVLIIGKYDFGILLIPIALILIGKFEDG
jgi:membrane-associated protease RseP (regulator of RpoE activity)